jgi:hypothetical protein
MWRDLSLRPVLGAAIIRYGPADNITLNNKGMEVSIMME